MLLDGVDVGRNHLVDFVPGAAHEAAQAALLCQSLREVLFSTMLAQASTGLLARAMAARQCLSRRPRTMGYFTRLALYRYQL